MQAASRWWRGVLGAMITGCCLVQIPPAAAQTSVVEVSAVPAKQISRAAIMKVYVRSLVVDRAGGIWIGSEDAGLYHVLPDRQTIEQITVREGLGDNSVFSLAVDSAGRIWVGHRAAGVSVLDGKTWSNYGIDTGPLGHCVFDLAADPDNGDVWMATDCGLARYSPASKTWEYYTTLNGLPFNAIRRVAIAADHTVIVGFEAEGIAVGRPQNQYATWKHIDGPCKPPIAIMGKGLPSCQITALAVYQDHLFVGTPFGLAHGMLSDLQFTYFRGMDWQDKIELLRSHPDPSELGAETPALLEDYVTALAVSPAGKLAVGLREAGTQTFDVAMFADPNQIRSLTATSSLVTALAYDLSGDLLVGNYGAPAVQVNSLSQTPAAKALLAERVKPAAPPPATLVDELIEQAQIKKGKAIPVAAFMGDDWAVGGDMLGHYGRNLAYRPQGPDIATPFYGVGFGVGPNTDGNRYYYYEEVNQKDHRMLYMPVYHKRWFAEWNDGTWDKQKYSPISDGPDLWMTLTLPRGTHRLALYFCNHDGRNGLDGLSRDYLIEVEPWSKDMAEADGKAPLCRARVVQFYMPVVKQFVLTGGRYYLKLHRQYSVATKCSAVFIDRLNGEAEPGETPVIEDFVGDLTGYENPHPVPDGANDPSPSGKLAAAWTALNRSCLSNADAASLLIHRIQLYRLALPTNRELAESMRWDLPIWTAEDRARFDRIVSAPGPATPK